MVQLQRNPPENGERRWRVVERKYQHVCVHEELQLWELGDVLGVMETLPQRRCPGPSRCPPLLDALWEGWLCAQSWVSQNQQEKAVGMCFVQMLCKGLGEASLTGINSLCGPKALQECQELSHLCTHLVLSHFFKVSCAIPALFFWPDSLLTIFVGLFSLLI